MTKDLTQPSPTAGTVRNRLAYGLLWTALCLMIGGVTLPAISVSSFFVFGETYSILGGILAMADRGDFLLAVFVFTVSVAFPISKIVLGIVALRRLRHPNAKLARTMKRLSALSRWSMADVLVLALLVIILNGQVLTTADIHSGVALFAMGVVASAVGLALVERRARGHI